MESTLETNSRTLPVSGNALASAMTTSIENTRQKKLDRYVFFVNNTSAAMVNLEEFRDLANEFGKSSEEVAREVTTIEEFKKLDELNHQADALARVADEAFTACKTAEAELNRVIAEAYVKFNAAVTDPTTTDVLICNLAEDKNVAHAGGPDHVLPAGYYLGKVVGGGTNGTTVEIDSDRCGATVTVNLLPSVIIGSTDTDESATTDSEEHAERK